MSLARTLANSPRVLLLDEPTSALDEAAQLGVEELICSILRAEDLTCLIVTHDADQARRMASHVVEMAEGRVVLAGGAAGRKAEVLRLLLDAEADVRQLSERQTTLEQVYLEATGQ